MTSNLLRLNPSKTEFTLIGLRDQLKKIPVPSISLNLDSSSTHTFTPTSPVRNLGVILPKTLVSRITSLSFLALASCISVTFAEFALCSQCRFYHWGCWGCIPLQKLCLLICSNNINGPPRATSKHPVPPMQYSDMALIMLVKCKATSKMCACRRRLG